MMRQDMINDLLNSWFAYLRIYHSVFPFLWLTNTRRVKISADYLYVGSERFKCTKRTRVTLLGSKESTSEPFLFFRAFQQVRTPPLADPTRKHSKPSCIYNRVGHFWHFLTF